MTTADRAARLFRERFGRPPAGIARAPGRANLLGEHVDYNDGFVLPIAIQQATYLAFGPSGGERSILLAADFSEEAEFDPQPVDQKTDSRGMPLPGWALYPAGVAWSLREADQQTPGMLAAYASEVPRGAGLSSSASVETAFAVAWQALAGGTLPPMELARLCQRAENRYVGMNCGIMDQFASACGKKGRALLLDCRSLEWQALPLPEEAAIVIADTSVRHNLVESGYNRRRASCEEAVRLLRSTLPGIRALRDVRSGDFYPLAKTLPAETAKRARYVIEEIERMGRAPEFLRRGEIREFGRLMYECHAGLRDLYEVSCPELDTMVEIAKTLPGCYGARLTGAGFGGCTVNLVDHTAAEDFAGELGRRYEKQTGLKATTYICQASDGAAIVA